MSLTPQRQGVRLPLRAKNVGGDAPGLQDAESDAVKPDVVATPPRKRAVPLDEVHARNVPELASTKRTRVSTEARKGEAPARPTTTRIDRGTRMSREERYQREQQKAQSQRQWKAAFGRAFPRFVFYLDALDELQKRTYAAQIAQLGARVDEFFSRSVTHVVTTRPVPPDEQRQKENIDAERARMPVDRPLHAERGIAPPQILRPTARAAVPIHSDRNPLDEWAQPLPANDLLRKAQHFGMKIWRLEKLQNILSLLLADVGAAEDSRLELSQMLRQEKLHGTTERDPLALRSDFYYFGKHSYYLLVTDATGEHRPVVAAEYDRSAHEAQGKPAPWPVLYGHAEDRGLFVPSESRDRRAAAAPAHPTVHSLRRTASLNLASVRPAPVAAGVVAPAMAATAPGTPNLMASDNSFALASAAASTTSTNVTSQGTQPLSAPPDRRVVELSRRMHTVDRRPDDERGSVVRRMLGLMDATRDAQPPQPSLRRSRSLGSASRAALKRAHEKRPGHCENCRCRYDDYNEHTRSRRHRKFALDESNFVALDELLQRVQRVPLELSSWGDYAPTAEASGDSLADVDVAPPLDAPAPGLGLAAPFSLEARYADEIRQYLAGGYALGAPAAAQYETPARIPPSDEAPPTAPWLGPAPPPDPPHDPAQPPPAALDAHTHRHE